MAAAARLPRLSLVLVPSEDRPVRDTYILGRMGCRAAMEEGFHPIYPPLLYGVFASEETLNRVVLRKLTMWWARRASSLIFCYPPGEGEEPELDALTYEVLSRNETQRYVPRMSDDPNRVPVHLLSWAKGEDYTIRRLGRLELDHLMKRHIVAGLLHGALAD